jgi:hypothetical protein
MKFSAFTDFIDDLKRGVRLCVMPVPRLELDDKLDAIEGFVFYPASTLDLEELRVAWVPADEFARTMERGNGVIQAEGSDLEWFKCAASQISLDYFQKYALITFTTLVNWELFLSGDHAYHCDLLREMSEHAETALDLLRFDFCRLHLPDTLPGRAGTFDFDSPYTGALIYTLEDHESYIVGGQVITHHLVAGLGLEISTLPETTHIGRGESGNVARRGLSLYSAAMESNSLTAKFIQCMSLLDFLAYPDDYVPMKRAKREIAAHVANSTKEYQAVLDDVERLTHFKDGEDRQIGLRTCLVHHGTRFEDLVPEKHDQDAIFKRLERYIGKTVSDLIALSDEPWSAVQTFRDSRKPGSESG